MADTVLSILQTLSHTSPGFSEVGTSIIPILQLETGALRGWALAQSHRAHQWHSQVLPPRLFAAKVHVLIRAAPEPPFCLHKWFQLTVAQGK